MFLYGGKSTSSTPASRGPKERVKRLLNPIRNSGCYVKADRYYSSVELAEELWKDFGMTLVGPVQQNRKHIPEVLKKTERGKFTLKCFHFLIQSLETHHLLFFLMLRGRSGQIFFFYPPSILLTLAVKINLILYQYFCNETNGGVDTLDQMVRKYTSSTKIVTICFFTLFDIQP